MWMIRSLVAILVGIMPVSAFAATTSVVTFESRQGIVLIDSRKSKAAYRLFESLNVPVKTIALRQTKIFAPADGSFRIACSAVSLDYSCSVIVYAGEHATLDFDTDRVELNLPADLAKDYVGIFPNDDVFHLSTEDRRLSIDWSPGGLRIVAPGRGKGRDI